MEKWTLCFALLLPLIGCFGREVTIKKTIRGHRSANPTDAKETVWKTDWRKPVVTPICTNETLNFIILIVCKMRKEGRKGKDCLSVYRLDQGFEHYCSSRFKLMTENQIFFLHLTNLTPEDTGNYSCECSKEDGTFMIHLDVSVEDDPGSNAGIISEPFPVFYLLGSAIIIIIIITGVILGVVCRRMRSRRNTRTEVSVPPVSVLLSSLDQGEQENPYQSLQQPASDVYQTISLEQPRQDAKSDNTATGEDEVYENF